MHLSPLPAVLAAMSLASVPALALADCHAPGEQDTAALAAAEEPVEPEGEPTGPEDLEIEDSAILPSAERHLQSEAPTMEIDCELYPEECAGEPIELRTEGPALSVPADPAATEPEEAAGAPVVAEPDPERVREVEAATERRLADADADADAEAEAEAEAEDADAAPGAAAGAVAGRDAPDC